MTAPGQNRAAAGAGLTQGQLVTDTTRRPVQDRKDRNLAARPERGSNVL